MLEPLEKRGLPLLLWAFLARYPFCGCILAHLHKDMHKVVWTHACMHKQTYLHSFPISLFSFYPSFPVCTSPWSYITIDPVPNTSVSCIIHFFPQYPDPVRGLYVRTYIHNQASSSSTLDNGFCGRSTGRFCGPFIVHSFAYLSHGPTTGISSQAAQAQTSEGWTQSERIG